MNDLPAPRPFPLVTAAVLVATLHLGRPFLMPVALALLLAFCLAPLVSRLERMGLGRILAVGVTTLGIGVAAAGIGFLAGSEISDLRHEGDAFRANLSAKLRALREPVSAIGKAASVLTELENVLDGGGAAPRVARVEVVERPSLRETAAAILAPLAAPVAVGGTVAVLTIFLLLQREDLRDRVLRLAGPERLPLVTRAIDDIAARLSRYLGVMALLCIAHGALATAGLAMLGIPGAIAWGVLAGALRIVPYVGPWLGASLAIAVALAAFPSFTPALLAMLLFVTLELIQNNVLEPYLYGSSAGVSPMAIVTSALFWTWTWGIPGLFLSTPLTLCLVALGRYVEPLAFLHVLGSEEPALAPEERLYQRLLALDEHELSALLATAGEKRAQMLRRAVRRLSQDERRGNLNPDLASRMRALARLLEESREGSSPSRPAIDVTEADA